MCCGDGSEPPVTDAWLFPEVTSKQGADYGLLLDALDLFLQGAFRRWPDIAAVGFEAPILIGKSVGSKHASKLSTLRLLYPMGAFVEYFCRRCNIPCHEVGVQEAKAEVTGKPNAKKEEVSLLAEKCGVKLPVIGRHDAGDSWSVWARLLRYYDPAAAERLAKQIYGPQTLV